MLEARVEQRRIGRHTLVAKLASGGMATVYLAQAHGELGFARLCAVKIIHPHLLDQPEFVARFLHEGKVASGIRHPHVVAVLDVGHTGDTPYLVLDYVRGGSIAELVRRGEETNEPPTVEIACTLVREALEGLHAVHVAEDETGAPLGLVHRDISHDNLLVSTDGVTSVTDLGIARARGVALTRATGLLGKAGYISPEQLAKEPITAKVDLFATGVVLWELLTGRRLFPDLESEVPMLTGTFVLEPPSRANPRVPPALDAFVARLLARFPEDRPRSAADAAEELRRILPGASRAEVAEWVQNLVEAKLERLDAIVREARASLPPSTSPEAFATPSAPPASPSGAPPALQSGAHLRQAPMTAPMPLPIPPAPARPRGRAAVMAAAIGGALVVSTLGLATLRARGAAGRSATPPPTAAASASATTLPTPPATANASAPTTASASAPATTAPTPSTAPRVRPTGVRPAKPSASPPAAPSAAPAPAATIRPESDRL